MKKEEPCVSNRGGRAIVMHLGVILNFYQSSQVLEVRHMISRLPISMMLGDIPLSPILPSTHVVDIFLVNFQLI